MQSYYYQPPLLKRSTETLKIMTEKDEVIGHVQRYFPTIFQRIADLFIGRNNLIARIKAANTKEHPNLVPYDELEDSDKEYDRQTALEIFKTIISFGYDISK